MCRHLVSKVLVADDTLGIYPTLRNVMSERTRCVSLQPRAHRTGVCRTANERAKHIEYYDVRENFGSIGAAVSNQDNVSGGVT